MTAIEDLLAKIKPPTASVRVCLRGDLLGELDLINEDLAQFDGWEPSSLSDKDPRTEPLARKADLEAQMRAESATFKFKAIGDLPWANMHAAFPAREGHEELFDPTKFPTALIAASAVDPTMTVEQAGQLLDGFTLSQRNAIFGGAYTANVRGVDVPFLSKPSAEAAKPAKK